MKNLERLPRFDGDPFYDRGIAASAQALASFLRGGWIDHSDTLEITMNIDGDHFGLTEREFLAELHHLLWMKPFKNGGVLDRGLSCRDHSAIVGVIARRLGASVSRIHGVMAASFGDTPKTLLVTNPHTWLSIDGMAPCDLSFKISRRDVDVSTPWTIDCIWDGIPVRDESLVLTVARSDEDLHKCIELSSTRDRTLVFHPKLSVRLEESDAAVFAGLDTPLKGEIKFATGKDVDVYLRIVEFLMDKLDGGTQSVVHVNQEAAWRSILNSDQKS